MRNQEQIQHGSFKLHYREWIQSIPELLTISQDIHRIECTELGSGLLSRI
jgi:hypothetical protein